MKGLLECFKIFLKAEIFSNSLQVLSFLQVCVFVASSCNEVIERSVESSEISNTVVTLSYQETLL